MESKNLLYSVYYNWWKNIDKFIFSLIIFLFLIGLFFSLVSTSLIASDKLNTNDYSFFFKHLAFIILGLAVIFIFYRPPLIELPPSWPKIECQLSFEAASSAYWLRTISYIYDHILEIIYIRYILYI